MHFWETCSSGQHDFIDLEVQFQYTYLGNQQLSYCYSPTNKVFQKCRSEKWKFICHLFGNVPAKFSLRTYTHVSIGAKRVWHYNKIPQKWTPIGAYSGNPSYYSVHITWVNGKPQIWKACTKSSIESHQWNVMRIHLDILMGLILLTYSPSYYGN